MELKNSFNDSVIESLVAFSNFNVCRVIIIVDEKMILDYGLPEFKIKIIQRGFNVELFSKYLDMLSKTPSKRPPKNILY